MILFPRSTDKLKQELWERFRAIFMVGNKLLLNIYYDIAGAKFVKMKMHREQ